VRFRDERPGDLSKARASVAEWRAGHPEGTPEQLLADVGHQFHTDWAPVLRAMLYVADKHAARVVAGIVTGTAEAAR